jgi:hypothetical protein
LAALVDSYRQQHDGDEHQWCERLSEVAREYLRGGELTHALEILGEAVDLGLPYDESKDDGLASAAACLHRRLSMLDAEKRFEMLHEWSMPTESRSNVRVLTTITPTLVPPAVFARALGERPRRDSFMAPAIGDIRGLFCSSWELATAADDTGNLRRLTSDLEQLADNEVPNARLTLLLARIVAARRTDESLIDELAAHASALADESKAPGLVTWPLAQRVWLFGSGRFDETTKRTMSFRVFPHWHPIRVGWCGGSAYPKTETDWCLVHRSGGSPGADHAAVRRWVAPADGTVSIVGKLGRRQEDGKGNGFRALIVSDRHGPRGEWTLQSGSAATTADAIQVKRGDTIDFVVDPIDRDANFDKFSWTVQLDLRMDDGQSFAFDSVAGFHGPIDSTADLAIAAACLTQEWLQPIGEQIMRTKLKRTYERESRLIRPFLRTALSESIRIRNSNANLDVTAGSDLELWVAASAQETDRHVRGAVRSVWLTHEDHTMHLAGPRSDYLFFKYPLTGEFEFSCEAQIGGRGGTDGCIGYGGLGYELWGAKQQLKVWTANHQQLDQVDCPFVANTSLATFNQFSLKSRADGVTLACSGHPTWTDAEHDHESPWITLRSYGSSAPVFRNMRLTGDPSIPREVKMTNGDSLRGWVASYYGERIGDEGGDWFLKDGIILGSRTEAANENPQSRLFYLRPLLEGESVSYEFQYEPGDLEVHPTLGRMAFLLEPDGVRLHWMTDGDREWTGLAEDNAVVEPLNRRGPRSLPLVAGEWNSAALTLKSATLALSLNGTTIYTRKLEPQIERTFGFYHDKNRSAVRVRNVVMRGDWPAKLSRRQLDGLAALSRPDRSKSDRRLLGAIFADRHAVGSALEVHARAATMPPEQRYEFLSDWVLSSDDHATLRMALGFSPADPPTPVASRGGELVAPALDLLACAKELDRLEELRDRVELLAAANEQQQRARFSLVAMIAMASGDWDIANQHLDQLAARVLSSSDTSFLQRAPETLAIAVAAEFPETHDAAREIVWHILANQIRKQQPSGSEAWDQHIDALANQLQLPDSGDEEVAGQVVESNDQALANWHPVNRATARTRGQGMPRPAWRVSKTQVRKRSGHDEDYLYHRVPLRGNYEVECDLTSTSWRTMELMVAGNWVGPWWNKKAYVFGNFREQQPLQDLAVPLTPQPVEWARYRAVVRDGVCTTFFNGRKLHEEELPDEFEPWLGIRGTANSHGAVRNLRISGSPSIPDQINLAASADLAGWTSYFEGTIGPSGDWRLDSQSATDGDLIGVAKTVLPGSHQEDLIRYHRPMIEDGVIEYDFYYRAGDVHVHPALDRLAFMLQPDGVRVHWVTDGPFDRTGLAPDNLFDEPENRRGDGALPLKPDDWNRLRLSLSGDVVVLGLNGKPIYRRKLEPTLQRTFGLFRYADRTATRVRNVVWRGEWPRELPPVSQQELAGKGTDFLDADLEKLTAVLKHDFATDGISLDRIRFYDTNWQPRVAEHLDGVLTSRPGEAGKYKTFSVAPRCSVRGDFDVTASFTKFEALPRMKSDKQTKCSVLLTAVMDDPANTKCYLFRADVRRPDDQDYRYAQSSYVRDVEGRTERFYFTGVPSEAHSGTLRMARRGKKLYYLIAEGDSSTFHLVGEKSLSDANLQTDGILLQSQIFGEGTVKVVWANVTIRAEAITRPRAANPPIDRKQ